MDEIIQSIIDLGKTALKDISQSEEILLLIKIFLFGIITITIYLLSKYLIGKIIKKFKIVREKKIEIN